MRIIGGVVHVKGYSRNGKQVKGHTRADRRRKGEPPREKSAPKKARRFRYTTERKLRTTKKPEHHPLSLKGFVEARATKKPRKKIGVWPKKLFAKLKQHNASKNTSLHKSAARISKAKKLEMERIEKALAAERSRNYSKHVAAHLPARATRSSKSAHMTKLKSFLESAAGRSIAKLG